MSLVNLSIKIISQIGALRCNHFTKYHFYCWKSRNSDPDCYLDKKLVFNHEIDKFIYLTKHVNLIINFVTKTTIDLLTLQNQPK